ncbi:MAG: hypothetical protein ACUVT9_05490 [Candidatus Bathycorpusculaceae bacterium]
MSFKGFNFNIFQKYRKLKQTALVLALISLCGWAVMGFDSSIMQILNPAIEILQGQYVVGDFWMRYNYYYGKEMHWSAFVIYGLAYWWLSRHFDKHGIVKSKNVCYSVAVTVLSIAIFEWFWMACFAIFQNQWWVITPKFPQLKIHLQNAIFTVGGVFGTLYLWIDSFVLNGKEIVGRLYRLRLDKIFALLLLVSVASALLWIYYPLPIKHFTVQLADGSTWTNSNFFPQTLYTIKTDPASPVNAGEWFWIEDNMVHAMNTLVKIFFTLTIVYMFSVRKEK